VVTEKTHTSVVVIGGGQAGLSVSFYLKKLGLEPGEDFVILDRGPITGGAWQFRWDALHIGSAHRINDLPGMDAAGISFENADRVSPAREVVADYYQQYEEFYGLGVVRPAAVTSVVDLQPLLAVTYKGATDERTIRSEIVINATGTWGAPFIPWYPGRGSFTGRQLHTAEYRGAEEFAGKKVVVVGGGTSAIGFLLEMESLAEELVWVSRRPIDFLEDGELNLEARQSAVALQDEAARAGRALPSVVAGTGVPRTRRIQAGIERGVLTPRPMFDSIEPAGVRWSNGAFQEADAIIWSTGFRPELRHLAPLRLREKEGGVSVANGTSWKDSRIFFAGYGPQASTIGANRAGRTIARQAIAALSRFGRERREEADAILAAATRAAAIKESEAATVEAAATAAAAARALAQPQRAASTWPDVELPALRLGEAVTVATATDSAAAARTAIDLGTATATVIDIDIDTATETGIDIAAAIGTSAASGHGDDALAEGDDESKRDSSDSEPEA
jgi:cation diffusion facilitator CzcD-associated flavoprotein CzcO